MSNKNIPRDPVWYPFTQMREFVEESPLSIASAEGNWLIDMDSKRYLDGVSSLWANVHGHQHPDLTAAIEKQLHKVAHSTLLGLTHEGAIDLARRLVSLAPEGLTRVFYSESGATAVEIALKMAYQYWQLKGEKERHLFLKLSESYHGDTIGAVSLGGMDLFHERFGGLLFDSVRIPTPDMYHHPYGEISEKDLRDKYFSIAEEVIERHAGEACGVFIEPLVQGAAGMIVHPEGYLRHIRELTRKHGILMIADEVAVGFGRTGKMFACEWEGVSPDLMCLGKGLTGGYLPLAATLASEEIFSAYLGDFAELKTFFHGHTYTGNPLGCAVALASLQVFEQDLTLAEDVFGPKAARYADGMRKLSSLEHVGDIRFRGLMGGLELVRDKERKTPYPFEERRGYKVCVELMKHGVILRPLGDVVVILPPLSVSMQELDMLFDAVEKAIMKVTRE